MPSVKLEAAQGSIQLSKAAGAALAAEAGMMRLDMDNAGALRLTNESGVSVLFASTGSGEITLDLPGTQGETLAVRDAVYLDETTNTWFKMDIDALPVRVGRVRGFVSAIGSLRVRIAGKLGSFAGLTPGGRVYVSTTPGGITQTKPTVSAGGGQRVLVDMGHALSATEVWVGPLPLQYTRRESLAAGAAMTIEHHSDAPLTRRQVAALLTRYDATLYTSYASSNQDYYAPLRGPFGGGTATIVVDAAGATSVGIGNATGTNFRVAQSFTTTAAASGQLVSVAVNHGANTGTPTGTVTMSICADNNGLPSESALVSTTYTPVPSSVNTVSFGNLILIPNTTYHVRIAPTAIQASGNFWTVLYNTGGAYTGGSIRTDTSTSSVYPGTWAGTPNAGTNDLRCTINFSSQSRYDALAESISVGTTTTVSHVNLWLAKTGLPGGDLTLTIKADSGGVPGAAVANGVSRPVKASAVNAAYGWVRFDFDVFPTLTAVASFWVELSGNEGSMTNFVQWGIDRSSSGYTGGAFWTLVAGTWTTPFAADAIFEVYTVGSAYLSPCVLSPWDSTGVLAARHDDGAGANANTRTTIRNITADQTLDVIGMVTV